MSKVTIKPSVVKLRDTETYTSQIPDGTFFTAGGADEPSLWLKASGRTILLFGSKSPCVSKQWEDESGGFVNYQPVDVEITYTPCK